MNESIAILKNPEFQASEDYNVLRAKGMEIIQKLGSALWTDYNIHDPGITILELLCYAQTEIGHLLGFSIEDLLASYPNVAIDWNKQGFYTARNILTVNPFTENDFRKVMIDQPGIANAWIRCSPCRCHPPIYADCHSSELTYEETEHPISIKGFWDVSLELDTDSQYGDLNGGKIFYPFLFDGKKRSATAEVRFKPWDVASDDSALMKVIGASELVKIELQSIDIGTSDANLYRALRQPLLIDVQYKVTTDVGDELLNFTDLPVRIWFKYDKDQEVITLAEIESVFSEFTNRGPLIQYLFQLKKAKEAIENVEIALHSVRNLAEDFCSISTIPIQDVGLCADIQMSNDADIEEVLGKAYYLIIEYLNPVVRFYTLEELLSRDFKVEDIFDGPKLNHGFILNDELDNSNLRTVLYTSDIINILMDIEGIEAVKNIFLTMYDETGKLIDSQPWELPIPAGRQPRLYIHASKVLVYKDDLPFLPRPDELYDTIQLWKGVRLSNKVLQEEDKIDLPVPSGQRVFGDEIQPIQYLLPETFGIGVNGLKEPSTIQRKSQAKQLRAYMLMFEHIFIIYLKQLEHIKDLLSINPAVSRTYFGRLLGESELPHVTDYYLNSENSYFTSLLENKSEFFTRRNQFLDHLLARFAESFSDYALNMYQAFGSKSKADEELILDKINFLENIPIISANRAKAFNYKKKDDVCDSAGKSGLAERIRAILGLNGISSFASYSVSQNINGTWDGYWIISNEDGTELLKGFEKTDVQDEFELRNQLYNEVDSIKESILDSNKIDVVNDNGTFFVEIENKDNIVVGRSPFGFNNLNDANDHRSKIEEFAESIDLAEKIFIVEHILLRPHTGKEPPDVPDGNPLLPICIDSDCNLCGEEDPFSYRITIVLNGERGISNSGIPFRRFAERSIRKEAPAHLGVKICWVSDEQLTSFEDAYCEWLLVEPDTDKVLYDEKLRDLIEIFTDLKSVYPQATLHDCIDGDDDNRVRLNSTII